MEKTSKALDSLIALTNRQSELSSYTIDDFKETIATDESEDMIPRLIIRRMDYGELVSWINLYLLSSEDEDIMKIVIEHIMDVLIYTLSYSKEFKDFVSNLDGIINEIAKELDGKGRYEYNIIALSSDDIDFTTLKFLYDKTLNSLDDYCSDSCILSKYKIGFIGWDNISGYYGNILVI